MQPNLVSSINHFNLGEVNLQINQTPPKKAVRAKAHHDDYVWMVAQSRDVYLMYYKSLESWDRRIR